MDRKKPKKEGSVDTLQQIHSKFTLLLQRSRKGVEESMRNIEKGGKLYINSGDTLFYTILVTALVLYDHLELLYLYTGMLVPLIKDNPELTRKLKELQEQQAEQKSLLEAHKKGLEWVRKLQDHQPETESVND